MRLVVVLWLLGEKKTIMCLVVASSRRILAYDTGVHSNTNTSNIKFNISQLSKYRNDKHVALFCGMDIIGIPYF